MNTKLQARVSDENAVVDRSFDRILSDNGYQVVTTLSGEQARVTMKAVNDAKKPATPARTITMFVAAPFIALAYIIALPIIGFYQIAKLAYEAYSRKNPSVADKLRKLRLFVKNVGLFLVSPFIALAYITALPFVGFYMFTKLAMEAHAKKQLNV